MAGHWKSVSRQAAGLDSGDHSVVEPPGPIPNPEVKRRSADGSGATGLVRVGRCQVFARHLREKVPGTFFGGRWEWRVDQALGRGAPPSLARGLFKTQQPTANKE